MQGDDIPVLQAAIESAQSVSVGAQLVQAAEAALKRLQVASSLSEALQNEDLAALQRVSAAARTAGVTPSLISAAESKTKELLARSSLATAVSDDCAATLRKAITVAREAHVSEERIAAAEKRHQVLVAAESLEREVRGEDRSGLEAALASAKAVGVELQLLAAGEAGLQRLRVSSELKEALESEDLPALQKALVAAKDVGVAASSISQAEAIVKRLVASRAVVVAMSESDEKTLQLAVSIAKEAHVPPSTLAAAEQRLNILATTRAVDVAAAGNDARALELALASAASAGVEPKHLQGGAARLHCLKAEAELRDASCSEDLPALKKATAAARDADVAKEHIQVAEAQIVRLIALKAVSAAVQEGNEQTIQLALGIAREADVPWSALVYAEDKLKALRVAKDLEGKHFAMKVVSAALQDGNEQTLLLALGIAREAGVPSSSLVDAEEKLKAIRAALELEKQLESKARMEKELQKDLECKAIAMKVVSAALDEDNEQTLQLALAIAREANVHPSSLEVATERLRALKARELPEENLPEWCRELQLESHPELADGFVARGVDADSLRSSAVVSAPVSGDAPSNPAEACEETHVPSHRFSDRFKGYASRLKRWPVGHVSVAGAIEHASVTRAKLRSKIIANASRFKPRRRAESPDPQELDDGSGSGRPPMLACESEEQILSPMASPMRSSGLEDPTELGANEIIAPSSSSEKDEGMLPSAGEAADLSKFEGVQWQLSAEEDDEALRPPPAPHSQAGLADPRWVAAGLGEHEQHSLPLPRSGGGVPGASKFEHPGWAIDEEVGDGRGPPMLPRTSWYRSSPGMQGASSTDAISPASSARSGASELGEKAADAMIKKFRKMQRDARRAEER